MQKRQKRSSCTSIIIGKKASLDGSIIIGRNEDSKAAWPKHFVVHPHKKFITKQSFKSTDNNLELPLPQERFKYTATPEWTDEFGLFEEDGINEYNVAMSATESAYSNQNVLAYDPLVKDTGIGEEAMVTITLPYVKTAKEGVLRLGKLIEEYGTSETNGILFADIDEAWYMETGSGHHWVAERIPDNAYIIAANQLSIEEIDFNDPNNFLFSQNLIEFVNKNHLNPDYDGFNFKHIFGTNDESDQIYNIPRVWSGQRMFNPHTTDKTISNIDNLPFIKIPEKKLSIYDAQRFLADHFDGTDYDPLKKTDKSHLFRPISLAKNQEAHLLQLRPELPKEIQGIQWLSMGVTAQSVFVPFYTNIDDTPEIYKKGDAKYSNDSAYWIFKEASVLLDSHYNKFNKHYNEVQQNTANQLHNLLIQSDQQIQTNELSNKKISKLLTVQNQKIADLAINNFKALISYLITESTDLSPLNFKTDSNL